MAAREILRAGGEFNRLGWLIVADEGANPVQCTDEPDGAIRHEDDLIMAGS